MCHAHASAQTTMAADTMMIFGAILCFAASPMWLLMHIVDAGEASKQSGDSSDSSDSFSEARV